MQFTSVPYLLGLATAVVVYFALPRASWRVVWLLAVSYGFYYSLSATWTAALLAITAVGYVYGLLLGARVPDADAGDADEAMSGTTKALLASGIVLVAATLFVFKYAGFSTGLLNRGFGFAGIGARLPLLELILPIGISFWTFQSIAYLVDVARGKIGPERDPLRYALFVSFFPHVTAGPIARGGQLLPQLVAKHSFSYDRMRSALLLMLWGFFKKLLVADPLGVLVNQVYAAPRELDGRGLVLAAATVAFAVQLYCDFSGYTDIVRGSARLFGVELLPNFHRPYEARSIKEFWRRWHMSLMGWLKDYVYIPLGGSRVSTRRRYLNVLAVFLLSGVWHGAGLSFVAWGLLNGVYQILGELLAPLRERVAGAVRLAEDHMLRRLIQTATTFTLISSTWVFFRAKTLSDALYVFGEILTPDLGLIGAGLPFASALSKPQFAVAMTAMVTVFAVEHVAGRVDLPSLLYRQPTAIRWALYQGAILAVVVFGYYGQVYSAANFAYFGF